MGGHSTAMNGRLRPAVPLQTQMSTYAFRKISNLAECCSYFKKDGPAVFMHFKNFKKQENNDTGKNDVNT